MRRQTAHLRATAAAATPTPGAIGVGLVTAGAFELAGVGWALVVLGGFFLFAAWARR